MTKTFLIAYDICDKKRLAKIAKITEREAFRVQRSIYLYPNATIKEILSLMEKIVNLIHQDEDDVRVYKLSKGTISLGNAVDLDDPYIFLEQL